MKPMGNRNPRNYGTFTCRICGTEHIKKMPRQEICGDCRRNRSKMRAYYRQLAEAEAAARASAPPASGTIREIDARAKEQGITYGDWVRAEALVTSAAPARIPCEGSPADVIFAFVRDGAVVARIDPGQREPREVYAELVAYLRRIRLGIIVYLREREIYLVKK